MIAADCPGVRSPVNRLHPARICQRCARYGYGADGIFPQAVLDDSTWECIDFVDSATLPRDKNASNP